MFKKVAVVLTVISALVIGIGSASAMSEKDLRNKIGDSFKVNGKIISIPETYLNQLDNYLAEFELSSADCDYISSQLDALLSDARAKDVSSFDELYKSCSPTIKSMAANISANTGVKITVLSNGKLQVNKYNSNQVWGILDTKVITNTNSINFLYIAGAITLIGLILFAVKVKRA